MSLEICPVTLRDANAFVEQNHRHHGKVVGGRWKLTAFVPTERKTPVLCFTRQLGERPVLWDISAWSPTYWRAKAGSVCGPQDGSVWDKPAACDGLESAARRWIFIQRK